MAENLDYTTNIHTKTIKNSSKAQLTITLVRKKDRYIRESILPASFFVMASWVMLWSKNRKQLFRLILLLMLQISFLIPHEAYPGRIAILFTLFLCTGIPIYKLVAKIILYFNPASFASRTFYFFYFLPFVGILFSQYPE